MWGLCEPDRPRTVETEPDEAERVDTGSSSRLAGRSGGLGRHSSRAAGLSSSMRERKRATTVQGKRVESGCGRAPGKSFRIQGAAPRFSRPWRACRGGVTDLDSLRNSFRVEICGIRNYLNCLKLGACGSILLNLYETCILTHSGTYSAPSRRHSRRIHRPGPGGFGFLFSFSSSKIEREESEACRGEWTERTRGESPLSTSPSAHNTRDGPPRHEDGDCEAGDRHVGGGAAGGPGRLL